MPRIESGVLALAVVLASAAGAFAANCGGSGRSAVLCSCGDTVTSDHKLSRDPVVSKHGSVCPGDGLVVAPGVKLNLGGRTVAGVVGIATTGINVQSGASAANGSISGFENGVRLFDHASLEHCRLSPLEFGIVIEGPSALASSNRVSGVNGCLESAIYLFGDPQFSASGATVSQNVLQSCRIGITVEAGVTGATVEKNRISSSGDDGIEEQGSANLFDKNQSDRNQGNGFACDGKDDTFSRNSASYNGGDGMEAFLGDADTYTRNSARKNTGAGISADSVDNVDGGGNSGHGNGGLQCEIAGTPCL